MTTIAAESPEAPFEFVRFLLVALAVLMFALVGGMIVRSAMYANNTQVPLKPCLSCPSCSCPKTLGSVKCLCPQ
jgi:hypothetical protein